MKSPITSLPSIPILDSLENLGALNGEGIYDVKPFRDWKDSVWRHKIFSMRLCNVGEGLDILEELGNVSTDAKAQMMKILMISRAVYMIDGTFPISAAELKEFNEKNSLHYDQKDYLSVWIKNTEQVILDRLDAVYASLQSKQIRQLQGVCVCDNCGNVFNEVPEGSRKLLYSVSEVICKSCLPQINIDMYDFEDVKNDELYEEVKLEDAPDTMPSYKCQYCEKEFDSYEAHNNHLPECDKFPF